MIIEIQSRGGFWRKWVRDQAFSDNLGHISLACPGHLFKITIPHMPLHQLPKKILTQPYDLHESPLAGQNIKNPLSIYI